MSSTTSPTLQEVLPSETRVALVTGAAQGIGRSIALRLVRDGYRVAASDLPQQLLKLQGLEEAVGLRRSDVTSTNGDAYESRTLIIVTGDVSLEDDVKRMVESCVEAFGRLDVVSPL